MRNCRGAGMVDAMVALLLLAMAGLIFSAMYPSGFAAVRQSGDTKRAVEIAQKKIEQVKALGYESISYANLRAANAVDISPMTSPYQFTSVDGLSSKFAQASGIMTITNDTPGTKLIIVVINWEGNGINRSVTLRSLVADRRPWLGS